MHQLTESQLNHLRRLLGWVRCEIGPTPEEMAGIYEDLHAKGVNVVTTGGPEYLRERVEREKRLPKYIRAAIKALEPVVRAGDAIGEVVDATAEKNRLEAPAK